MKINDHFRLFAHKISQIAGSPYTFGISCILILVWGSLGPVFKYSNTWQLFINSTTTIVTSLMVFLIQNTQNRDARELHLKLDELIRSNKHARNQLIELEELSDEELDKVHDELCELNKKTEERIKHVRHHRSTRKKSEPRKLVSGSHFQ